MIQWSIKYNLFDWPISGFVTRNGVNPASPCHKLALKTSHKHFTENKESHHQNLQHLLQNLFKIHLEVNLIYQNMTVVTWSDMWNSGGCVCVPARDCKSSYLLPKVRFLYNRSEPASNGVYFLQSVDGSFQIFHQLLQCNIHHPKVWQFIILQGNLFFL